MQEDTRFLEWLSEEISKSILIIHDKLGQIFQKQNLLK